MRAMVSTRVRMIVITLCLPDLLMYALIAFSPTKAATVVIKP